MAKQKSFLERLTGAINNDDGDFLEDIEPVAPARGAHGAARENDWSEPETDEVAQLTVDLYQTPSDIVVQTIAAGIAPGDLDISITREMVTIAGQRARNAKIADEDYFHQELYWGAFSRTILLPEEIDVEEATAEEHHGLVTLRLPKIDKKKSAKLTVKSK